MHECVSCAQICMHASGVYLCLRHPRGHKIKNGKGYFVSRPTEEYWEECLHVINLVLATGISSVWLDDSYLQFFVIYLQMTWVQIHLVV